MHQEENIWVMSKPFTQSQLFDKFAEIFHLKVMEDNQDEVDDFVQEQDDSFSLEGIKSFTGDDEKFLKSVIHTFITNTNDGLRDMNAALEKDKPFLVISERAHKLLTGFRQFKIEKGIIILSSLEESKNERISVEELVNDVEKLKEIWSDVKVKMMALMS